MDTIYGVWVDSRNMEVLPEDLPYQGYVMINVAAWSIGFRTNSLALHFGRATFAGNARHWQIICLQGLKVVSDLRLL